MNFFKILGIVGMAGFSFIHTASAELLGPGASGGGGVTNPSPVYLGTIKSEVESTLGVGLIAWFRSEEGIYRRLGEDEKLKSPFRKVFESKQSIFTLIHDSKVEVREDGPCLDSAGNPQDGSIFPKAGYAICLSAFTMTPKLNYLDVTGEVLALAAHEYSHLLGTNEEEALAIQTRAVSDLHDVVSYRIAGDIAGLSLSFDSFDYVGPRIVNSPFYQWREFINARTAAPDQLEMSAISDRLGGILGGLSSPNLRLQYVPYELERLKEIQAVRFAVAKVALCAIDPNTREDRRQACAQELDQAFPKKDLQTYFDYSYNLTRDSMCLNSPDYCYRGEIYQELIRRPRTIDEVRVEFGKVDNYLKQMKVFVRDLSYCGGLSAEKNCQGTPETWNPPKERNFELKGKYNDSSSQASCSGSYAWPKILNTECKFEGEGVKPDFDGTFHFRVLGNGEAIPYYCSGDSLSALTCVQYL